MLERYAISIVTAPSAEPISLADAKTHLRIGATETDDDAYITALIVVARRFAESYCTRSLVQQTFDVKLDCFPRSGLIDVPRPPLVSITSITFVDVTGTLQTIAPADYQVDAATEPGRIFPAATKWWPFVRYGDLNPITIRCVAGYPVGSPQDADGLRENVPGEIKSAMLMLIGHLYEHREMVSDQIRAISEQEVPMGTRWLLSPYRAVIF
jgi:uncharacterized phiE125 gp8 family phage protein